MAEHIAEPDRQKSATGPEQIPSQTATATTTTTYDSGHCQQGTTQTPDSNLDKC